MAKKNKPEKDEIIMVPETKQLPDYEKEIINIIKSDSSPIVMRDQLEDYHKNDIAAIMTELDIQERIKLYRVLEISALSSIFEYIDPEDAAVFFNEMDLQKAASVISGMETDTSAEVLRGIEKDKRLLIIELLDETVKRGIALIASFDEDEIGSRMTTNYIVIRENLTIKQSMSELIEQASKNDNISTLFVVDENGVFYGAVNLKDLITARQNDSLEDMIVTSFPYVYGHESIDNCIERLKDYSEDYIPVLDNNNYILGVITLGNIVEVVDDEMGDDYAKFAGLTAEEDLSESLTASLKKRLPWLLTLLALGMVVSSVVGMFEKVVSQLTLIVAFQSLILDMAGNVGTQSLAVTIRVLMDESLSRHQKVSLVIKEMKIGLCNGTILGCLSFALVGLYIFLFKGKTLVFAYAVSGCIGISLVLSMLISSAVGTLIPLFFKKIKVDPAVASGPLITTINDLVAVIAYYGMAWILLLNILKLV